MQPRQPDINVLALRNSTLLTPDANILEGITRETIFALAGERDWPVPEALLPTGVDELGERPGPAAVTVGPDAGAKACYLGDPDGITLELFQRRRRRPPQR